MTMYSCLDIVALTFFYEHLKSCFSATMLLKSFSIDKVGGRVSFRVLYIIKQPVVIRIVMVFDLIALQNSLSFASFLWSYTVKKSFGHQAISVLLLLDAVMRMDTSLPSDS